MAVPFGYMFAFYNFSIGPINYKQLGFKKWLQLKVHLTF